MTMPVDAARAADATGPGTLAIDLPDEAATRALGARLAAYLRPGMLLGLSGPLGAGKTTLAQGIARGLGIGGPVPSPSFTLIREHPLALPPSEPGAPAPRLLHMDLYRLESPAEVVALGIDELLGGEDIVLIEWPERAAGLLPDSGLALRLSFAGAGRRLTIEARGEDARALLAAFAVAWARNA